MTVHIDVNLSRQPQTCGRQPIFMPIFPQNCMKRGTSNYVNARGIPTAAYQVLHLLCCMRWGIPPIGVPPQPGLHGGYSKWGTPCRGNPLARSDGGDVIWRTPHLDTPWPGLTGGYLRWGTHVVGVLPQPGLMSGNTLPWAPPAGVPPRPGLIVGNQGGVPPQQGYPIGVPSPQLAGP